MVIIQLAGGLGNQMFQYALYLQLKSLGKEVKIDDVSGFAEDRQRKPVLASFGVAYEQAGAKEMEQMLDSSPLLWHKVKRKLIGRRKKAYFEEDKRFKPEIFRWDDIYLEGYWQTEKYFQNVAVSVREIFDTDKLLRRIEEADGQGRRELLREYLEQIETTDSVSVHVRGGDYLLPENEELFGGICTSSYYEEAMDRMRKEHPDCVFYLFTNDEGRAKEYFGGNLGMNMIVVKLPEGGDHAEFALMSKCRHNILANSSFSWWASYLNKNPQRMVLAPDRWLNGWDCRDFYREDMITVRGK